MSLVYAREDNTVKTFISKIMRYRKLSELEQILKIFEEIDNIKDTEQTTKPVTREIVENTFIQLIKYGRIIKKTEAIVNINYDKVRDSLQRLESLVNEIKLLPTIYRNKWVEPDVEVYSDKVEEILKPLEKAVGETFSFKEKTLKMNEKFYEAITEYVRSGKIHGVSVFDEKEKSLLILSKIESKRGIGFYYTMFLLRVIEGKPILKFMCTCPYAMGETLSRNNRKISPKYTSICKHGLALLFFYYPDIASFIKIVKNGEFSKNTYEKYKKEISEAMKKVLENVAKLDGDENIRRVTLANILYQLVKHTLSHIDEKKKLVPTNDTLPEISDILEEVFNAYEIRYIEKVDENIKVEEKTLSPEIMQKPEITRIYNKIRQLRQILNMLQGAKIETPYTTSLLASIVLGSDLLTDPVIVSVVGDPGTGKTLTVEALGKLLGIRTLVIEKEIDKVKLEEKLLYSIREHIEKISKSFKDLVLAKIQDEEKRKSIEEKFENTIGILLKTSNLIGDLDTYKYSNLLAKTINRLSGRPLSEIEERDLAEVIRELLEVVKRKYSITARKDWLAREALEERRKILSILKEHGLISSVKEKEEVNAGSVRWEIDETINGLKIRVLVDTHYLIRKLPVAEIRRLLQTLSSLGLKLDIRIEAPGVAELKLSEIEYLEKALRVREEDILSPARRLIWVGGDLTKKPIILIDESRRAPELLEKLLTDLSSAARDTRRTNIIVTTDNAEPLMDAEKDPRLDAFHSRVNFEVITPSTTVAYIISKGLKAIERLEKERKLPLLTLDEALVLNKLANYVKVKPRYEEIFYSLPLIMIYDFKILRPELYGKNKNTAIIILQPKQAEIELENESIYVKSSLGDVPAIRMMPERRFGHHSIRASKILAVIDGKTEVDDEVFKKTVVNILLARTIPVEEDYPYLYLDAKMRYIEGVIRKLDEFLSKPKTEIEKLIDLLASMKKIPEKQMRNALEEMINNPIATAVFVRFLEEILVSDKKDEFLKYAEKIPGLPETLEQIARYEKIYL